MPATSAPSRRASVVSNSSAMHALGNHLQYRMLQIAHHGQPTIEIELDESQHASRFVTSYSTMDTIEGKAHITAPHDTRFEDIEIAFTGTASVFVERLSTSPSMSGRTEAAHKFLTMKQPIGLEEFPSPRILRAGKKYTFPFVFAVPAQLLPRSCPHAVASDYVRETHLMLPPSMGDAELSGFGSTLLDDMAPEMAKISYGIKVRIMQLHDGEGKTTLLAQKTRKVRVKPAFEEQPPLPTDDTKEYRPHLERPIKKGLFKGKAGTLSASAAQPPPLTIPGARTLPAKPITTLAKVLLRFDPAQEPTLPPKLGSLKTTIKVSTFYASAPRHNFPSRENLGYDTTQGVFTESVPISTMCIGTSATWVKQPHPSHPSANPPSTPSDPSRRDSAISDCSTTTSSSTSTSTPSYPPQDIPRPTSAYKPATAFYTAAILVPIALPPTKNFLPTFHSCLVSRVYALSMHLSVHAPGGLGVGDVALALKVPLQVCAEGSVEGRENARVRGEEVARGRGRGVEREQGQGMGQGMAMGMPMAMEAGVGDLPPEYVALVAGGGGA